MEFQFITLTQGSQEWHEFRKGKIGASHAAAIMGVSPYVTRLQCWEQIAFDKKMPDNPAMERGRRLESKALEWYNKRHLFNFQPKVVQSKRFPDLIASLDGWDGKECLEIKCPSRELHEMAKNGEVPVFYYPQLQHQMMLTNTSSATYLSFDGTEGVAVTVLRDSEYISNLLSEELAFLASIIDFRPPKPCDRDWQEINDQIAVKTMRRYREVMSSLDRLEEERDELRRFLTATLDHPRCLIDGAKVQKVSRKGNYDVEKIIQEYKIKDSEKYRKPNVESWRIDFDQEKG